MSDIDDELLPPVDEVIVDNNHYNKLDGIGAEADEERSHAPARQKKKPNIWLIVSGATVAVIVLLVLIVVFSSNSNTSNDIYTPETQQDLVEKEASLFSSESTNELLFEENNKMYDSSFNKTTAFVDDSSVGMDFPAAEPLTTLNSPTNNSDTTIISNSNEISELKIKFEQLSSSNLALLNQLELQQNALNELTDKVNKKPEITGSNDTYVTKATHVEALKQVRALSASVRLSEKAIKALEAKVGNVGIEQPEMVNARIVNRVNPAETRQSAPVAIQQQINNPVNQANRNGPRELAWSSWVENYGIATVEGSSEPIELRPGDHVLNRGVVDSISSYGCIRFVNGDLYAPTNGVCK